MCLSNDGTAADDLVQETFVRALGARQRPSAAEVQPWLGRILKNAMIDRWRRLAARQACELDELGDDSFVAEPDAPWWHDISSDELLVAVRSLPAGFRDVLLLRMAGYSNGEAARSLGITTEAVATRLCRGRQLARHVLEQRRERESGA